MRHLHLGWLCCCCCGSRCCWSGFSWRWWQCCGRGCRYCCCGVFHSHLEFRRNNCPRSATAQEDVVLNLAPGVYIPLLYQLHPSSQFVNLSIFFTFPHPSEKFYHQSLLTQLLWTAMTSKFQNEYETMVTITTRFIWRNKILKVLLFIGKLFVPKAPRQQLWQ